MPRPKPIGAPAPAASFTHAVKLWLVGDVQVLYRVTANAAERIAETLRDPTPAMSPFIVFQSDQLTVALRRSAVRAANLLWEPVAWSPPPVPDPAIDHPVRALLSGLREPLLFEVEPDPAVSAPSGAGPRPLDAVLGLLASDSGSLVTAFRDADDEDVLLDREHLILFEVPRIYLDADRWAAFAAALTHAEDPPTLAH